MRAKIKVAILQIVSSTELNYGAIAAAQHVC